MTTYYGIQNKVSGLRLHLRAEGVTATSEVDECELSVYLTYNNSYPVYLVKDQATAMSTISGVFSGDDICYPSLASGDKSSDLEIYEVCI